MGVKSVLIYLISVHIILTKTELSCVTNSDCQLHDANQVCNIIRGLCGCGYGSVVDNKTQLCVTAVSSPTTTQITLSYNERCKLDSDCQLYDTNRVCSPTDSCVCRWGYYEDPVTKLCNTTSDTTDTDESATSIIPYKYCDYTYQCGANQFCASNQCECIPNYFYNQFGCQIYQSCYYYSDCQQYDPNRQCNAGVCVCKPGYELDTTSLFCVAITTTSTAATLPYEYCVPNNCPANQFCVNNRCQCLPGYVYNYQYGMCVFQKCSYDYECQLYDKNRACNSANGKCVCSSGNKENAYTRVCNTTVGTRCAYNSDCTYYGDYLQVCVDYTCQCEPDYRWTEGSKYCQRYSCHMDYECQQYDRNRYCDTRYNWCSCKSGYSADAVSMECEAYPEVDLSFLWALVGIPFVIFGLWVASIRRRRRLIGRAHHNQRNQSIQTVSAIHSPAVTINDPPPPYSSHAIVIQ